MVRLGFAAEAADHHPDMLINYKRVTLTFITHSEGGLTDKDFAGAAQAAAHRRCARRILTQQFSVRSSDRPGTARRDGGFRP